MKRIYKVRIERGNRMDVYEFNVAATNGIEAALKGKRQAIHQSGYKLPWRVTNIAEQEGSVIV